MQSSQIFIRVRCCDALRSVRKRATVSLAESSVEEEGEEGEEGEDGEEETPRSSAAVEEGHSEGLLCWLSTSASFVSFDATATSMASGVAIVGALLELHKADRGSLAVYLHGWLRLGVHLCTPLAC